jgi:hypothetical protein
VRLVLSVRGFFGASICPRIGLDDAEKWSKDHISPGLSLSNARSKLTLSVASAAAGCGVSLVSSTDGSSAPPPDPRILAHWVSRRFVLCGTFDATLLSSTPAHSPIVACAATRAFNDGGRVQLGWKSSCQYKPAPPVRFAYVHVPWLEWAHKEVCKAT